MSSRLTKENLKGELLKEIKKLFLLLKDELLFVVFEDQYPSTSPTYSQILEL